MQGCESHYLPYNPSIWSLQNMDGSWRMTLDSQELNQLKTPVVALLYQG